MQLRDNDFKLFIPFSKSNVRVNFCTSRMLRIWNVLLKTIVCSNVITVFKVGISDFDFFDY